MAQAIISLYARGLSVREIQAHLQELYGVEVEVSFVERLRGMVRFDGVEALVETMRDDVARTRALLA